jgi:hypothetical protein
MGGMVNSGFGTSFKRWTMIGLRNALYILHRPPLRVHALTDEQKNWSMQWAMETRQAMKAAPDAGKPMIIAFADESRYCFGSDGRWVRYRRGQWNETA